MSGIKLFLLGPPQLQRDDQPVALSQAKGVALLLYLAVKRMAQAREQVADALWPESLPQTAGRNLRNLLWRIRHVFGDDVVATDGNRLSLAPAVWADVRAFEDALLAAEMRPVADLESAATLYRGLLGEGLSVREAPAFETWLAGERERFSRQYLELSAALVARQRQAGNWQAVTVYARRALAHDKLQEPMHRALMEAQAQLGQRSQALRQYEMLRDMLQHDLAASPLPETEALRNAIRDNAFSRLGQGVSGEQLLAASSALGRSSQPRPAAQSPFVGREAELMMLHEELQRAARGEARVVMLAGELGIGKSRLCQQWLGSLPSDAVALATKCLQLAHPAPLGALAGLFRGGQASPMELPAQLAPIWLAELARLLPDIQRRWPNLAAPLAVPPAEAQLRLFTALAQALRLLTDGPLVLFVDDLHWADSATLDWLVYFGDQMQATPLVLVGTYRPQDASAQLESTFMQWQQQQRLRHIQLPSLSLAEASALLTALGQQSDQKTVAHWHHRSGGNPYFLLELSRATEKETPPNLAALIHTRLTNTLPSIARQVLQAAAVLQGDLDVDVLRRTSGRSEEETLDALDALLAAAVLVERGDTYEFAHPLVATVVYEGMSAARRRFVHRRAAEALETMGVGDRAFVAGQLATHYAEAGDQVQAAAYAELAADRALQLTTLAEAVALYRQAIAWQATPQRRLKLAEALLLRGSFAEAQQLLQLLLAAFEAQQDHKRIARTCLVLARSYLIAGQRDHAEQWLNRIDVDNMLALEPEVAAQTHLLLTSISRLRQQLADADFHLQRVYELGVAHNLPRLIAQTYFERGNLLARQGNLPAAITAFRDSLQATQAANDLWTEVITYNNLAYHEMLSGDVTAAWQHIEDASALAERYALGSQVWQYLYSTRGELALAVHRPDEADHYFAQALHEAEALNNTAHVANVYANQGLAAQQRGDLENAVALLHKADRTLEREVDPFLKDKIAGWLRKALNARSSLTQHAPV